MKDEQIQMEGILIGALVVGALLGSFLLGMVSEKNSIAKRCEELGGFSNHGSVYKCQQVIIGGQE